MIFIMMCDTNTTYLAHAYLYGVRLTRTRYKYIDAVLLLLIIIGELFQQTILCDFADLVYSIEAYNFDMIYIFFSSVIIYGSAVDTDQ